MSRVRVIPGSRGILHLVDPSKRGVYDSTLCGRGTERVSMTLEGARFFWPNDRICRFCEALSPSREDER
jgi:hypothetical protein